ncbi:MAG: lysylphosphatidylglycerol synthase transmembrane domain-containing protein [Candidatus Heimdallarchaeota archaeon]
MMQVSFRKRGIILPLAAFILMAIYFYFLGPQGVLDKLTHINIEFIILIIVIQLTGAFFVSLAWRLFLQVVKIRASIWEVYSVYLASFGYGLLIPSMSAVETAIRIDMSKKIFGRNSRGKNPVDSSTVLSSIVLHKMIGGLVNIPVLLLISYSLVVYFELPPSWALAFMIVTTSFLSIMLLTVVAISYSPEKASRFIKSLLRWLAKILPPVARRKAVWEEKVEKFAFDYHHNFKILAHHWKRAIAAGFLVLTAILMSWINLYLLILALSVDIEIFVMIAVSFIGSTLNSLPLGIPGMEGIKEILVSESLRSFLSSHESGAIALLYSFIKFYVPVTAAILISLLFGIKPSNRQKITEEKEKEIAV